MTTDSLMYTSHKNALNLKLFDGVCVKMNVAMAHGLNRLYHGVLDAAFPNSWQNLLVYTQGVICSYGVHSIFAAHTVTYTA